MKIIKTINKAVQKYEYIKGRSHLISLPTSFRISLTTTCNYSCPICPMAKAKKAYDYRDWNIDIDDFRKLTGYYKMADSIDFYGLLGEGLLNEDFNEISAYCKDRIQAELMVSTNGAAFKKHIQEEMVKIGFDRVTFSIHSAVKETYDKLQGGDFSTVIENLEIISKLKSEKRSNLPAVNVVHAVNKYNYKELNLVIDLLAKYDINSLTIYHYHDYGGFEEDISLEGMNDNEAVNNQLKNAYKYAKEIGVLSKILPSDPPIIKTESVEFNTADNDIVTCNLPWKNFIMRGSILEDNTYYCGCCNVFNIFKLNYKNGIPPFKQLWNHPILRYLRENLSENTPPPICRYCKSDERKYLKAADNKKNNQRKDEEITKTFELIYKKFPTFEKIDGVEVLLKDPSDIRLDI